MVFGGRLTLSSMHLKTRAAGAHTLAIYCRREFIPDACYYLLLDGLLVVGYILSLIAIVVFKSVGMNYARRILAGTLAAQSDWFS